MLKSFLFKIRDHRRKQGRRYELGHILFGLGDSYSISETAIPDDVYQEPITETRNRIESRKAEVFISSAFTGYQFNVGQKSGF